MKTNFKIAWVDDNLSDDRMQSATDILGRRLKRKNSFSLEVDDVYSRSGEGKFDKILSEIASAVDSSNNVDLAMIDYELGKISDANGEQLTGPMIAKRFRDALPTLDIVFYSGKKTPSELRKIMAENNVDCVSCMDREYIANDTTAVIEKILHRSYKISTLRGLILNTVCEIDHVVIDILKEYYSNVAPADKYAFCNRVADFIVRNIRNAARKQAEKTALLALDLEELLQNKKITSGSLFGYVASISGDLNLDAPSTSLFDRYSEEILELRNTAAHAKEIVCSDSGQAMLQNGGTSIKHGDIDGICVIVVAHERNFLSILQGIK